MNSHSTKKTGIWLMIAAWVVLLALATVLYQDLFFKPKTSTLVSQTGMMFVVEKNYDGHFVIPGKINQVESLLLLDTGATYVAVPQHIASRAELEPGRPITLKTANGKVKATFTYIEHLRIGPFQLNHVKAVIIPDDSNTVLLGMSALKHFHINQKQTELILKALP